MRGLNAGSAFAACLVDELARLGLRHACVSPGSRSTPLAVALDEDPRIAVHVVIDERSAAFLALGIAKASETPCAVVSTSGTAAANFLPAIVEADQAGVPLIVLTADRPPELRGAGANQTIDQVKLYGDKVRWFSEVGVPEPLGSLVVYWRSLACRAWGEARASRPGPVHLNVAFREPLLPDPDDAFPANLGGRPDGLPWTETAAVDASLLQEDVAWLLETAARVENGLIVAGAYDRRVACIDALARAARWPLLAEPVSGLRQGEAAISTYEALLRHDRWEREHIPEFVLRVGKLGLSRVVNAYLGPHVRQALIDPAGAWLDSERAAERIIAADASELCGAVASSLTARRPTAWWSSWQEADGIARRVIDDALDQQHDATEPGVARDLAAALPDGSTLVTAASMPVRDLDWFMAPRKGLRVLANRGANGIDGFVSTALGAAIASERPTYALAGDLSLLHDQNGLLLARSEETDLVFVVLNNDGGGIFSFLPQADAVEGFERMFATPHGIAIAHLASLYGCGYQSVRAGSDLVPAVEKAAAAGGVHIIEVPTNRDNNVVLHRSIWAAVARSL